MVINVSGSWKTMELVTDGVLVPYNVSKRRKQQMMVITRRKCHMYVFLVYLNQYKKGN